MVLFPSTTTSFRFQRRNSRQSFLFDANLSKMRIHRLPEELAPPHPGNPLGGARGFVTGIRMPSHHRGMSLRGSSAPLGLSMVVDSACTLLVCFHDAGATTDASIQSIETEDSYGHSHAIPRPLDVPKWATELGLAKTGMRVRERPNGNRRSCSRLSWMLVVLLFIFRRPRLRFVSDSKQLWNAGYGLVTLLLHISISCLGDIFSTLFSDFAV